MVDFAKVMAFDNLLHWMRHRELCRIAKEKNLPRPWGYDPIIETYRFCNVNRNHDKVTKYIHEKYYGRHWFNYVIARLFNQPHTLEVIGLSHPNWRWGDHIRRASRSMASRGLTTFNSAYIVSTNGVKMDKVEYIIERVLAPIAAAAHTAPATSNADGREHGKIYSCRAWGEWLRTFDGMGPFIANQVVTDLKYTPYLPVDRTPDWTTFVYPGPGTRRGLNRVYCRDKDAPAPESSVIQQCLELREKVCRKLLDGDAIDQGIATCMRDLNNLTNCLCEFDKYMRAKNGEGRPKQIYYRGGQPHD